MVTLVSSKVLSKEIFRSLPGGGSSRERTNASQEAKRWIRLEERAGMGVRHHMLASTVSCTIAVTWALTVQYFFLEIKNFLSQWLSDSSPLSTNPVNMQIF